MPGVRERWKWMPGRESDGGLGGMVLCRERETVLQKNGNMNLGAEFGVCHRWTLGNVERQNQRGPIGLCLFILMVIWRESSPRGYCRMSCQGKMGSSVSGQCCHSPAMGL